MQESASEDSQFDPEVLAEFVGMFGVDNLLEVLNLMQVEMPRCRAELLEAAARGNLEALRCAAHKLRSDCAHVGARGLAARLQALEDAPAAVVFGESAEMLTRVDRLLLKFLDELQCERKLRGRLE